MISTPPFRLLTVDDEEAIRSGVAAYFEDSGFVVAEADDGLVALDLVRTFKPDIVVTDLRMPNMDGLELIDAVTAEFDNLPIIVLSGTGVLSDAIDALRRGAWDYLTKPVQDLAELEIIVHRSLERSRLIRENKAYQNDLERLVEQRTVSLRKLTAAVEQSANSVLITDTEGVIEYGNPRFCTVSGYSAGEVIGKKPNLLKSGHQPAELYHDLWRTIRAGQEWRGEFRNKRKNGTLFWELCSIAPIRDDRGEITNFVAIKEDITARKAQESILTWQASHDTLTGLHNRHYLESHLASELMKIDRARQRLSLLLVGIDNLKSINDTFGHDVGDTLLVAVGKRLQDASCPSCVVGRFLGDEFCLIPPLTETTGLAESLAWKAREHMAAPFQVHGLDLVITASIGVVTFPDDCSDSNNLLCNAEAALYEAKKLGRNSIVLYTSELHRQAQHRLMLENRLHKALENNEFSLHYQPQICMATGSIIGVEALLRWASPDMPVSTPAEFVPILEESCLIVPVGAWVLREACRQVVAWQAAGLPRLRLSVNISAVQFQQGDLNETVRQIIHESGIDPSLLCLEVTESILMRDMEYARTKLSKLRDLGICLSLDDFGTGYSSLAYLSELPIQELKVDRSFIQRLHETPNKTAVVNTIIAMAQELGLEIVAEGVETEKQKNHLSKRNCTTIQGFLFSKPLPAERLLEFVVQWNS